MMINSARRTENAKRPSVFETLTGKRRDKRQAHCGKYIFLIFIVMLFFKIGT